MFNDWPTAEDHLAGFKDVPVFRKDGSETTVKLVAPAWRRASSLSGRVARAHEDEREAIILEACLPTEGREEVEATLGTLDPGSLQKLSHMAFCLAYGADAQKKMQDQLRPVLKRIEDSIKAAVKSSSSAAATPSQTSTDSASQPSSSGSPSVRKRNSTKS